MTTIKVELLAIQEGQYTVYVFNNLDEELKSKKKYLMCTRLPNWNYNETLEIGDIGYLMYDEVRAGSTYYCPATNEQLFYKYSNCYFVNFIKVKDEINNKEFKF